MSAERWTREEEALRQRLLAGQAVVINLRRRGPHARLADWAEREGLLEYIGRANRGRAESLWANPYRVGPDGSREDALTGYRDYLPSIAHLEQRIAGLRGRALGCWCKPEACHGDELAARANRQALRPVAQ